MFSPSKVPNRSARSWPKNKNGLTFQKLGSPKASLAQFLDSFMLWELTTSWRSSLSEGVGWETQATRLLHSPDYSLKAYSDFQHLNQGPQRSRLPGRLRAVSEFWKGKYWNTCTDAQTFLQHLVKLICNALYRNKARSVASRKQSSNSKEEKNIQYIWEHWRCSSNGTICIVRSALTLRWLFICQATLCMWKSVSSKASEPLKEAQSAIIRLTSP